MSCKDHEPITRIYTNPRRTKSQQVLINTSTLLGHSEGHMLAPVF